MAEARRLELTGEVTIYRAAALKAEVLAAVAGCTQLEINLAAVTEIDTTGVQLLLLAKRDMAAQGGQLHLVGHAAPVVEAMDLYGLSAHFGDPVLLHGNA